MSEKDLTPEKRPEDGQLGHADIKAPENNTVNIPSREFPIRNNALDLAAYEPDPEEQHTQTPEIILDEDEKFVSAHNANKSLILNKIKFPEANWTHEQKMKVLNSLKQKGLIGFDIQQGQQAYTFKKL